MTDFGTCFLLANLRMNIMLDDLAIGVRNSVVSCNDILMRRPLVREADDQPAF